MVTVIHVSGCLTRRNTIPTRKVPSLMKRMQRIIAKQCKPCVNYLWDELDTDKVSSIMRPPQADSGALWEVSL